MHDKDSTQSLLTVDEFLSRCPISKSTLWRWIESGAIDSYQPAGKNTKVLIPVEMLNMKTRTQRETNVDKPKKNPTKQTLAGPGPKWTKRSN